MGPTTYRSKHKPDQPGRGILRICLITNLILAILAPLAPVLAPPVLAAPAAAPAAAPTNVLTLNVISARSEPRHQPAAVAKGDAITQFKYIINIDNTGTTTQRSPSGDCAPGGTYPANCQWTSIAGVPGSSPIYTQGDQSDFSGGGLTLPDGRYLISVMADGFKLDGAHFTMPVNGPVTVELQPHPLPDAMIRAFVFQDEAITNSAPDVPVEQGLAGFTGSLKDYLGQLTTDVYGNPLCTVYQGEDPDTHVIPDSALDADQLPIPIPGTGGKCVSDATGMLAIPHLGTNRYALSVTPPDGTDWVQTTTLEGNHDWDAWIMEGATGYDTEFVVAGEPFPTIIFGFVKPKTITSTGGNRYHIRGSVAAAKVYVPAKGGLGLPGTIWGGMTGAKLDGPIPYPWLSLNDLNNGDAAIWVGKGDANGNFDIPNVPDGNYTITWWDEDQNYILDLLNVTVRGGDVSMGILPLTGWWTKIEGYVFNDTNRNGIKDPGEPGMPNFTLTMRKRENSLMDRGATLVTTDANGYYVMENAYPMTQWLVEEAYNDLYYTTGVTYQADNQPTPTTVKGAGVDVSVLPIIGLGGKLDWGVHAYDPGGATCNPVGSYTDCLDPRNGGIVGTVSYDTTRNELDPRFAAVEDWQPGVSNITVNLYATVPCNNTAPCDATGRYKLAPDGSYAHGNLLNTYVTESWERPKNCQARDVDGNPLVNGIDEKVLPPYIPNPEPDDKLYDCLEGPLMGVQFGTYATAQNDPANANFGAAVDGNYGFGDGCFGTDGYNPAANNGLGGCADGSDPTPLLGGRDYLVEVKIPQDALGRPMYQVTREEDINIANGDQIIPQVPPPACAGALHTVDVDGFGTNGYPAIIGNGANNVPTGVTVPASAPVDNPTFLDIGSSPYEGMQKPLCDTKLVTVSNGRSIVPTFNVFTDVPLPGRFWGLAVDDLNFSADPKSLLYGEKAGIPFAPVGVYDYTGRLVTTVESDFNGLWDVLLPSTNRISCPTPSGVCANLYRFVGNDPGIPGRLNPNYRPEFRTIATEFEAFPGLLVPADLAPTQVGVTVQLPGGQVNSVSCKLDAVTPQLLAVSQPYVNGSGAFTIKGVGFGPTQGAGQVTLDGTVVLPVTAWNDTDIAVTVPANTPIGPHQLNIKAANGQSTINGLTFHVRGSGGFSASLSTALLDNFNRNNSNNAFGGSWNDDTPNNTAGNAVFNLNNNQARVRTGNNTYNAWWGNNNSTVYGTNQEAYFTFTQVSNQAGANEQGLLLKFSGSTNNPNAGGARWIEVTYDPTTSSVKIFAKTGTPVPTTPLQTFTGVTFGAGDQFGARALANGTITVYKNGVALGPATASALGTGNGRIGVRFTGTGTAVATEARFDDFGGGTLVATNYLPNVYEVGPGKTYDPTAANRNTGGYEHALQDAIDAAVASNGDDLVVVYPNLPSPDPRVNPRGAYYENLIITAPIKLQGVGPGGFQGTTFVPGSILDGGAFGGDTALADAWRTKIATMVDPNTGVPTWQGNPNINDGETIYLLAMTQTAYGATYKASIDGFDLRGGDQQGFPTNINQIGGGPTGLPPNITTQGGAIFANAYVRNLQITNNVVQNNGGGYGTIRIGTPDLAAPNTNQHNENVRIANNRVIANGGTNLAGGIGLFAGADGYEVAANDICGNFSAEYGGGLTVYGRSPNGKIHDNRIYFNRSYDEGGGIMLAGELPATSTALSPGTGPVDIYNNLIQANLGNDDGGGIRFLMAGGPGGTDAMNVYNNIIVNNVSTHEGGGISLNDAPNVRVYNNTIMKNITTATAVTSNGQPAPAGLSTSANSTMLQATLPSGSPTFSNPLLFNNIFWDNRAGTRAGVSVTGIGLGGAADTYQWDLGVADAPGSLTPTNSILQVTTGTTPDGSNISTDPAVVATYDTSVAFSVWRNNPNFVGAILAAVDLPANLLGNYHLQSTSPAQNRGAASKTVGALTVNAPSTDIDHEARPALGGYDSGADEYPGNIANLSISKTDNQTTAARGSQVTYSIVVANGGPNDVSLAPVVDNVPAVLTGVTWTCTATGSSSCNAASGSGNAINTSVNLANGGSATFTVVGTLPANSTDTTLTNTATVSAPAGTTDPNTANNSATDTDTIANPSADLAITKTDNQSSVNAGGAANYTIVVTNNGPNDVTAAAVADTFPSILTVSTWTCTATGGSSCTATGTGNNRTGTVTLISGGSATFTANTTVSSSATGNLVNTATVTAPADRTDPNTTNNSATDTDTIVPTLPTLNVLDNFNRANANTLNNGSNWDQNVLLNSAAIRVNGNQAFCSNTGFIPPCAAGGTAYWNNPTAGFGATQGAAFTFASTPVNDSALILKASGSQVIGIWTNFIRVRYNGGQVIVETTTNGGVNFTSIGSFTAAFANGDQLTAVANTNGSVDVWKTTSANVTTYVGHSATSTFTSTGRIGMRLPSGARVDDFKGGNTSLIVLAVANAFPQTTLLSSFTAANGALDNVWTGATGNTNFRINGGQVQSQRDSGSIWWQQSFGANQEAFLTIKKRGTSSSSTTRWQGVLLKLNGGEPENANATAIDVRYATTKGIQVRTKAAGQGWTLQAQWSNVTFKNGDQLGAQAQANGTVIVYKNGVSIGSVNVTSGQAPWSPDLAAAGGQIGVTYNFSGGRFDNFGGGDMTEALVSPAAVDAIGEAAEADVTVTEPDTEADAEEAAEEALGANKLFLPLVAADVTNSEQSQAAALATTASAADQIEANPAASQLGRTIYLPLVSNQ